MTPEITTRSFSNDQLTFDKVFFDNLYNLKSGKEKDSKELKKVFVDIGAHAGFFAFSALVLGAKKVYCFEPYIDNFNVLLKNCYTHSFVGRVTPYQLGVYTQPMIGKFSAPELIDGLYFDLAGIGLSISDGSYYPCQCVTLDTILREYCFDEQVDVLKINIGYAEKEILLGSEILPKNVNSVCGEVSCSDSEFAEFKKSMGIKGFINCYSTPLNDKGRIQFWMSKTNLSDNFIK